jgi:hypothetical protein
LQLVVAFLSTVVVCGLLIFGARTIILSYFDEDTGNNTLTLTNPITDSEKTYLESVTLPPGETEDEIIEGSIAESSTDHPDEDEID